jgi:hypothetical protein
MSGPTGATGPKGHRGPAGRDALIACHRNRRARHVTVTCAVALKATRNARFRAHLYRHGVLYATGSGRSTNGSLTLHPTRATPNGTYTLAIRLPDAKWVALRATID